MFVFVQKNKYYFWNKKEGYQMQYYIYFCVY